MMLPAVGGGAAFAHTTGAECDYSSAPSTSYAQSGLSHAGDFASSWLTTYGVRAGSAGPDYLGISNTNFDFTAGSASQTGQYTGWTSSVSEASNYALGIWGSSVNETPNPYIWNLFYNTTHTGSQTGNAATTYMSNLSAYSSWGDINVGQDAPDVDIVFGANKYTNWRNFSAEETNIYDSVGDDATYANNDATNIWTQIYTMGQLADAADDAAEATGKSTRYDESASECAENYEKSIRGNMLYVASQIDLGQTSKKTVAYLYAIDGDTAYFFTPQANGLVNGTDAGEAYTSSNLSRYAGDNAVANSDYAANNGTIDLGYMDVLPFITDTFDSGHAVEGGIQMTVEDILKANPACTISTADLQTDEYDGALSDVDVIIFNTDKNQTRTGRLGNSTTTISSTVMSSCKLVEDWAAAYGFSGSVIAGDDFGTSKNQITTNEWHEATETEAGYWDFPNGTSPLLYCQRNYTADKNARAAWAFSQVYPDLYGGNVDASYSYWVNNVYHVKTQCVPTVVAKLTNKPSTYTVTYDSSTNSSMEAKFNIGWAWWNDYGQTSDEYRSYMYYKGSSRASFYDGRTSAESDVSTASNESGRGVGIFVPSWTPSASEQSSARSTIASYSSTSSNGMSAQSLSAQAEEGDVYNSGNLEAYNLHWELQYNNTDGQSMVGDANAKTGIFTLVLSPIDSSKEATVPSLSFDEDTGNIADKTLCPWRSTNGVNGVGQLAAIKILDGVTSVGSYISCFNDGMVYPISRIEIASSVKTISQYAFIGVGVELYRDTSNKLTYRDAQLKLTFTGTTSNGYTASSLASIGKSAFNPDTVISDYESDDCAAAQPVSAIASTITYAPIYIAETAQSGVNSKAFNTAGKAAITYVGSAVTDISGYTVSAADATYTGSEYAGDVTVKDADGNELDAANYTLSYATSDGTAVNGVPTAAGSYTVTATGVEDNSYAGTTEAASFAIAKASVKAPEAATGLAYTGSEQTGVAAGEGYTVTGNAATDAGSYTATAALSDPGNYAWEGGDSADLSIEWSIAPATVQVPKAVTGLVYDGKAKTGVAAGEGYTVTGNTATNAGSYTATVTPDANHAWADGTQAAQKVNFAIAKATQKVTASKGAKKTVTYKKAKSGKLGATKTIKAKAMKTKFGLSAKGTLTFKKANAKGGSKIKVNNAGKVTVKKGLKKGTYKVKVKVTAKATANYKASAAKYVWLTVKVK